MPSSFTTISVSTGAVDLFVLLTGGDTRQIENELEKIDLYLGGDRQVQVDQVRELVPRKIPELLCNKRTAARIAATDGEGKSEDSRV